jgi:hypothetical protein
MPEDAAVRKAFQNDLVKEKEHHSGHQRLGRDRQTSSETDPQLVEIDRKGSGENDEEEDFLRPKEGGHDDEQGQRKKSEPIMVPPHQGQVTGQKDQGAADDGRFLLHPPKSDAERSERGPLIVPP